MLGFWARSRVLFLVNLLPLYITITMCDMYGITCYISLYIFDRYGVYLFVIFICQYCHCCMMDPLNDVCSF